MMGSKDLSQLKSFGYVKAECWYKSFKWDKKSFFFLPGDSTINKASPKPWLYLLVSPDAIFNKLKELNMKRLACHINLIYNYL